MADIKIHTAQNTVLLQNKASLGERMIATFLDLLIIGAYFIVGSFLMAALSLDGIFWLLYSLPVYFYTLVLELVFHGQTFGKRVMKVKVVHCEGRNVPFSSYVLRWLLRLVDIWLFFGCIGVLVVILSKKGQRIGDIAANTIVVSTKGSTRFYDLPYKPKEGQEETVMFSQATLLDDDDIEVIREVLAYGKEKGYQGKAASMIIQTSDFMKKKLSIETKMTPGKFLEQLLNDYYVLYK